MGLVGLFLVKMATPAVSYIWMWAGMAVIEKSKRQSTLKEAKSLHQKAATILQASGQEVPEDMPTFMAQRIVEMSERAKQYGQPDIACTICGLPIEEAANCDGGNCTFTAQ